jgi:hypothetical protein
VSLDEVLVLHCYICSIILIMACTIPVNPLHGKVELVEYVLYSTIVATL